MTVVRFIAIPPHMNDAGQAPAGFEPTRLAKVQQLFEQQHARGKFPGGQLVVRRRGRLALSCSVGLARGFRREEEAAAEAVTPQTRFQLFSASKPVVAVAIAMLEERGLLDVNAPVATFFPGFAANGKAALTVLDVLTHRAGVFTPDLVATPEAWGDEARVREALIAASPRFPRGTLAYMPYEWGWILAEVVRGATGRPLSEFIVSDIATAAGLPGLRFGALEAELPSVARAYWVGARPVHVAGAELSQRFERDNNLAAAVKAFVPAAGLVCTATELAGFYEALPRLISAQTLHRYTTGSTAFDRSNRLPLRMARGFLLGSFGPSIYGWWGTGRVFGHAGAFCTLGYRDPDRDLSVAIVTNGNAGPSDSLFRCAALGSAIRRACSQDAEPEPPRLT